MRPAPRACWAGVASCKFGLFVCLTQGDEWEEKWGEHYHDSGKVAKYADKWGKSGAVQQAKMAGGAGHFAVDCV